MAPRLGAMKTTRSSSLAAGLLRGLALAFALGAALAAALFAGLAHARPVDAGPEALCVRHAVSQLRELDEGERLAMKRGEFQRMLVQR